MKPNLYVRCMDGKVVGIIMPDELGENLPKEPRGEGWYAVQWPVNPHFTGEYIITEMFDKALQQPEFIKEVAR